MKFPIGALVLTPTGRLARVVGTDNDMRLHLMYEDCGPKDEPKVIILKKLLRPAPTHD